MSDEKIRKTVFVEIMAVFVCVTLSQRQNIAGCSSKLTFYSAGVVTPRHKPECHPATEFLTPCSKHVLDLYQS
jgi:hypothetical protein